MSTITIDDIVYAESDLSNEAKSELGSMQICDQRIEVLQTDLAIAQTARNAYANALMVCCPRQRLNLNLKLKLKLKLSKRNAC